MLRFILFFLLMIYSCGAIACDCDEASKLKFRDAAFVVTGKMKKVEPIRDAAIIAALKWPSFSRSPFIYKMVFEVDSVLKSDITTNTVTVYTHSIGMSECGFPVIEDDYEQRYEIYAEIRNGFAFTWMCTGSRIMLDLEE